MGLHGYEAYGGVIRSNQHDFLTFDRGADQIAEASFGLFDGDLRHAGILPPQSEHVTIEH